jgi:predicted HD superfamily hydrolase involved in NAD metabolism
MLESITGQFTPTGHIREDVTQFLVLRGFPKTAEHVAGVADRAKELAERFAAHPGKAEVAGYLHDISAIIPGGERIAFALRHGVDVLPEEVECPMISHQKLSVVLARELFQVTDADILSAVGCHTTLKANASRLDKVVFLADKMAWDQEGDPPYLQAVLTALDDALDAGVLVYLNFLWDQRSQLQVVHPWFIAARQQLLQAAATGYVP